MRYKNQVLQQYYVQAERRKNLGHYNVSLEEALESANSNTQLTLDEEQDVERYIASQRAGSSKLAQSAGPECEDASASRVATLERQLDAQTQLVARLQSKLKEAITHLEAEKKVQEGEEAEALRCKVRSL